MTDYKPGSMIGLLTMGRDGQALVADSTQAQRLGWAFNPPTGSVVAWAGSTIPAGWLPCDGISRHKTHYPDLYAVIGDAFGGTSTHFRTPDLKGLTVPGAPRVGWIVKT